VDGIADEQEWPESISIDVLFESPGDFGGNTDLSGVFKVCYDIDAFYLFIDIIDDIAHNFDPGSAADPWLLDNAEIYFNLDTTGIFESGAYGDDGMEIRFCRGFNETHFTMVGPDKGPGFDDPSLEFLVVDSPGNWQVETKIPWKYILPAGSEAGDIISYLGVYMGFEIKISDSDGSDPDVSERDAILTWDADGGLEDMAFMDLRSLGILHLKNMQEEPIADAGEDQEVYEGDIVTLDGTSSYDYQDDPLNYAWLSFDDIEMSDTTLPAPTFTAPDVDEDTELLFGLIVNDGSDNSVMDTVIITVDNNQAPIADAGRDHGVQAGQLVILDGSDSSDPEEDTLQFEWTSLDGIVLSATDTVHPEFIAPDVDYVDSFRFSLVVSDGKLSSQPDTIVVTVLPNTINPVNTNTFGEFILSPNPAKSYITIDLGNRGISDLYTLKIRNIIGQLVMSLDLSERINRIDLDASIGNGYYIVTIENNGELLATKKLYVR